jgi:dTDP-4-amino-4,6-dideoxygalactose transaminase
LAVSALSTPHAWSLARRIPGLRIGAEDQSFDTRPSLLSPWQAALGTLALSRLDEYNALRTRLGQALEAELADVPGIHLQTKTSPRESAYVRLALRLESEDMPQHSPIEFGLGPRNEPAGLSQSRVAGAGEVQQRLLRASSCLLRGLRVSGVSTKRDAIARALQSRGIDARAFYTRTMPEYDWWQLSPDQPPCPQAKRLIASNLTLPLHYSMTEADVSRIARLISDLLSS